MSSGDHARTRSSLRSSKRSAEDDRPEKSERRSKSPRTDNEKQRRRSPGAPSTDAADLAKKIVEEIREAMIATPANKTIEDRITRGQHVLDNAQTKYGMKPLPKPCSRSSKSGHKTADKDEDENWHGNW